MTPSRSLVPTLLLTLALVGCQGVPIGHYRFRLGQEPMEFGLGLVALPFALAGDMLLSWAFLADPLSYTEYAFALLSPFHNAIDAGEPAEVPGLPASVRATRSQWVGEVAGPRERLLVTARALLLREGWRLSDHEDDEGKVCTEWRVDPGAKAPLVARRLHVSLVEPDEGADPSLVTIRVRYELGGPVHGLIPDAPYAADEAQIVALHEEAERAADELEDVEPSVSLVQYHSLGRRGKAEVEDDLDARRGVHQRRMESAQDDALDLEDQVFLARAEATRRALARHGEDVVPALWEQLEAELERR